MRHTHTEMVERERKALTAGFGFALEDVPHNLLQRLGPDALLAQRKRLQAEGGAALVAPVRAGGRRSHSERERERVCVCVCVCV